MGSQFMTSTLFLAANFRAIGLTVAALVFIVYIALFVRNVFQARPELGSEVELAANRREYLSDEELEGPKLDRSLSFALVCLGIVAMIIPFYWLAEPGRQEGAIDGFRVQFEHRGRNLYLEGAQCVNCHAAGGVGGSAPYVLQDADGQFIASVTWAAPALNNVLNRYSEDEVTYILNYGRPGTPMAAWGVPGGGPLTEQQVEEIIAYMKSFQIQTLNEIAISEADDPAVAQAAATALTDEIRAEVRRSIEDGEFDSVGEAVFNLGLFSNYQSGTLSCARCHTAGWSLGIEAAPEILTRGTAGCGGGNPSGIGFSLCGGSVANRFPDDTWRLPNTGTTHVMESSAGSDGEIVVNLDGGWLPAGGLIGADGRGYLLAADGVTRIQLDDRGAPVQDAVNGFEAPLRVLDNGDLAACAFESQLWPPGGGPSETYPWDPREELILASTLSEDDDRPVSGPFVDPERLTEAALSAEFGSPVVTLSNGRLAAGCTIIEMPERTSNAHYDFIYNGATAGAGYGRGGQSPAGMMPGFGGILPPDLIQAVVDYERGL